MRIINSPKFDDQRQQSVMWQIYNFLAERASNFKLNLWPQNQINLIKLYKLSIVDVNFEQSSPEKFKIMAGIIRNIDKY